jgi:hypothetical protein
MRRVNWVYVVAREVSPYLVAEALGGNDGNFIADTLIRLEIKGEPGVVAPGRNEVSN